jgi:hypothetical protein
VARSRAEPCSRCGAVREAATRDEDGRPLCPHCLVTDPASQETCAGCDRRRPVSVRTLNGPLCATCTRSDAGFWTSCPACGETGRIHAGRCAHCSTNRRLSELLGDEAGEIRPHLRALYQALASTERPGTVAAWLDKSAAPSILRNLDAGSGLTHAALDALPGGKPVEHLRNVLVAIGTLPHRDEQMARLERWITTVTGSRVDPGQQHMLHHYAVWHLLRRLRRRTAGADTTHDQLAGARQHVKAAIAFLDWLIARDLTLAACRQNDLDTWITSGQARYRRETGHFIRWAKKQKLTSLVFPATRWGGPSGVIDTEARWNQARRLLHDESINPEDRVAGLLVLLCAQWPSAISRLTLAHVHADDQQVQLSLGREPVTLPEPLAGLIRQMLASRSGHAAIGDDGASAWLFPGGQPGRPISSYRLAERLREHGIHSGQARSTALFQLATDLPAVVLARMPGIHVTVAVAWQRASAGDWAAYAAEVSRRTPAPMPFPTAHG